LLMDNAWIDRRSPGHDIAGRTRVSIHFAHRGLLDVKGPVPALDFSLYGKKAYHILFCMLNTVPAGSCIQCMFSGSSSSSSQVSIPLERRYSVASATWGTVSCNQVSEWV